MGSEFLAAAFPLVFALAWLVAFIWLWIAHLNDR